ncbi:hypothetical protein PI125_g3756 [Phytophthora idaei]|nr:hypothetical protein PI125_g3756 [Phytophthora idaei]
MNEVAVEVTNEISRCVWCRERDGGRASLDYGRE